ncbi:hypothetical protein ACFFF5_12460 [Lederbergia wuyishanensis]|uniref:RNA-binding protein n=1 Tax=Lederbergia wuyishanensis TaxID=1347903 RepID=A0ABU0D8B1_9BACI|nr:hypothetical protein [Lederbergia wuyishanensis]MCJ8009221.1 hypothetical protein [Lederbergia wuyishanensis]MDQ0344649.1 putative RNA-binding protein [Lederbergia wuyishanensis]
MTKQRIGNIGLLNLTNATEESIQGIEGIDNVGLVLYKKENAHLISALNIGNIGKTAIVPEGYSFFNGILNIDKAYIESIKEPVKLFINGIAIIDNDVQVEQIKKELLQFTINGIVYSPAHLSGSVSNLFGEGDINVTAYQGEAPRIENGKFTLSNSFLQSLTGPQYLVVNGILTFSSDLNMEMFNEKISDIEVNGKIVIYEEQEPYLYRKMASLTSSHVDVIPAGHDLIESQLRLNSRSIRRFKHKRIMTKRPIVIDADVSREALSNAFSKIHSPSMIICHENVEDIVYELCSLLETEVLVYEKSFIFIENEEEWSNDQFLALKEPANFVVRGVLTLDEDVELEVLQEKVAAIDLMGEIIVSNKKLKGSLQQLLRLNNGNITEKDKSAVKENEKEPAYLNNIGELSL